MNKALIITGCGLAIFGLGVGVSKVIKLKGKADAAQKLLIDFDSLTVKSASVAKGVVIDVVLKATNNSPHELKFTQPFVVLSILNDKKSFTPIANSSEAVGDVILVARETSPLKFNLTISPAQALKIPALLMHLVKKVAGLKPAPKKILIEYGLTSEGFDINQKKDYQL